MNIKCVLIFYTDLSGTFFVLKIIKRNIMIKVHRSSSEVPVIFRQILMKLEFCRPIFGKYSDIKFNGNPSTASLVVPCRQTDGRTKRQT